MNKIILPENVEYIIHSLQAAGYEAYAVGGCVRDCILGNAPADWDITTSALPEQVKSIFPRTIDTGIKHGTVTIMLHSEGYEVTTYRIDGDYNDGRHPDSVSFTACLEEDLKRRDFTINAFVYNNEDGIIDMFDGLSDLKNGVIRCVGNPLERFNEDALRILRALRFAARFSFKIDPDTLAAMKTLAHRLSLVSAERIRCELDKTLVSANPDYVALMNELGIDRIILPELAAAAQNGRISGLKTALRASLPVHSIRWAILCSYLDSCPAQGSRDLLRRLKFDNQTIDTVCLFVRNGAQRLPEIQMADEAPDEFFTILRFILHDIGPDEIFNFLNFKMALALADNGDSERISGDYDFYSAAFRKILESGQCTRLKELAVNGRDLINRGFPAGEQLGSLLDYLLVRVIRNPELNTPDTLFELAMKWSKPENE